MQAPVQVQEELRRPLPISAVPHLSEQKAAKVPMIQEVHFLPGHITADPITLQTILWTHLLLSVPAVIWMCASGIFKNVKTDMISMDQIQDMLFSEYQPVKKFTLIPVQKQCIEFYFNNSVKNRL